MTSVVNNRLILYRYLTQVVLPMLKSGGFWGAPDPAPLNAEEVTAIFKEVAAHSSYRHQNLETATSDGKRVTLKDGVVSVSAPEMN